MPEQVIRCALHRIKRRLWFDASLDAALLGSASVALLAVSGVFALGALAIGGAVFAATTLVAWRRWTDARVVQHIEAANPSFQNILVTAQEALAGRIIHPVIASELLAQAADRLQRIEAEPAARTLAPRVALAAMSVAAALLVLMRSPQTLPGAGLASDVDAVDRLATPGGPWALRVRVTPPPYARRQPSTFDNPEQVHALEGSTIRVEVPGARVPLRLVEPGGEVETFAVTPDGAILEITASTSRVFLIRRAVDSASADDRLLQLQVQRDERPVVTIERPGRDLLFGAPSGTVSIVITARDDISVAALSLRYTQIAGSGETFTFEEGELPLRVAPASTPTVRQATGTLLLDQLKLRDGDTLVYRALARDDKPGADPVTSESFLVEIGTRGVAAASGFSLPEERDRQGLSQQMLIVKTERLHADRSRLGADALLEQSRLLAVEQRMVRAEFVFMSGGEVVDEVEEAEHAHELAAGRLENAGQVELLNAIREMSRAEARLNAGDTGQALVFERAALRALERAFDRRRYFLRALPERSRIDPSRRLSGDASSAKPSRPSPAEVPADPVAQHLRQVMAALSAAVGTGSGLDASLAARVIARDPESPALQQAAARLSSSAPVKDKVGAAAAAQVHLAALLRRRLLPGPAQRMRRDPLAGLLAGERQP